MQASVLCFICEKDLRKGIFYAIIIWIILAFAEKYNVIQGGICLERQKRIQMLENGDTALGVEFGSTRIKAVLVGSDHAVLASGSFSWENRLENGIWTYPLEEVWQGLQASYAEVKKEVLDTYGVHLKTIGSMGFSAMMHGYLPFSAASELLTPFRTWRNTMTERAAAELTELFHFNIPQRWSVAHLYHAILNQEPHIKDIAFLTTLAGYVHWQLTGEKVLGVGEASGMFPIDSGTCDYDKACLQKFDAKAESLGFQQPIRSILPAVLKAGASAGKLTAEGALKIDPTGDLPAGIPLCPPEGDAGTGMAATNSVEPLTGNVSAGTSIFAMAVLEKPLSAVYPEIDMVTTPDGAPVAMVHCNTCTSDLDAWVRLFSETLEAAGKPVPKSALYDLLYQKALEGDADCGGLLSYNYYAGEPVTGLASGKPLFVRQADNALTLPNFMRSLLFSTMATLRIGMDILFEQENLKLSHLCGHGGLFKTKAVGQKLMAGAMHTPVVVMKTAGEGGAWGIALLALYMRQKAEGETLTHYLNTKVFGENSGICAAPEQKDIDGFDAYLTRYKAGLAVEKAAAEL